MRVNARWGVAGCSGDDLGDGDFGLSLKGLDLGVDGCGGGN